MKNHALDKIVDVCEHLESWYLDTFKTPSRIIEISLIKHVDPEKPMIAPKSVSITIRICPFFKFTNFVK